MTMKQTKSSRPARRLSSDDFVVARQTLSVTALTGTPHDLTQRKAFKTLVPTIYALKKMTPITFRQITDLCNQCGFKLTPSTARSYYTKFAPLMQKECEAMVHELSLAAEAEDSRNEVNVSGFDNVQL